MFPGMNPMGERMRHDAEIRQIMRRNEHLAQVELQPWWAWTKRLPRVAFDVRTRASQLSQRLALTNGRSLRQSVDSNPC